MNFDEAYYQRFYLDPKTRVYDQQRHSTLVSGVVNMVEWLAAPVESVLDVGAGLGWWGQWLQKFRPGTRYFSTEYDSEICKKYGHQQADISNWCSDDSYNLVVCQGVLPYLTEPQLKKAIKNLGTMCGGFLYLEAITSEDLAQNVDVNRTDIRVHPHPAAVYRKELDKYFREVGAGLFASRASDLVLYALEARAP